MEHHGNHPVQATISMVISIISAVFAWVSIKDVQIMLGLIASCVAIISGVFAIRYYYYSTKKLNKDAYKTHYKRK